MWRGRGESLGMQAASGGDRPAAGPGRLRRGSGTSQITELSPMTIVCLFCGYCRENKGVDEAQQGTFRKLNSRYITGVFISKYSKTTRAKIVSIVNFYGAYQVVWSTI